MTAVLLGAAALTSAAAVVTGLLGVVTTRRLGDATALLVDLLIAAALLRLTAQQDWPTIGVTGVLLAVRYAVGRRLAAQTS
ncbi:hypothetical protein INN71_14885 [Nocardioides sp. ChNu-153]|uniref:hypothetical protein n=1 Tax=unclassified Nocardioides TaxID=2615069 RepID=UPI002406F4C9|nr:MULTISPECIES: hypothetical protein [unclassified Nocardioides]MDF9717156.1 hypothetical protein [Nocardioides sp. ChNu-99]MDN7122673.1 hypothetical protein [Nocardioides sp. ChNu-153]